MYHVSAQCVDEHMINVHYYYYYYSAPGKHELRRNSARLSHFKGTK